MYRCTKSTKVIYYKLRSVNFSLDLFFSNGKETHELPGKNHDQRGRNKSADASEHPAAAGDNDEGGWDRNPLSSWCAGN